MSANIEDLRGRVKVLLELLNAPEPGLAAWRQNYEHAAANVLSFFGYGQTAGVLSNGIDRDGILRVQGRSFTGQHPDDGGFQRTSGPDFDVIYKLVRKP